MASQTSTPDLVLIEDNEDELIMTMRAMRRSECSYQVKIIRDGLEALEFVAELQASLQEGGTAPNAMFLDLHLPGVDGKRVLQKIRAHPTTREIPVVVVSSTRRSSEIGECYRLGANSFISKQYGGPQAGEYLIQAMRYWVELNRASS